MHYNTQFQHRNLKNFLGRGTAPPQTAPHPLGAYGASIVAPSALHTLWFRRSVLCVPYFQCRLLAALMWLISSRVNEVNGENLQDPPNQKSWLRQCTVADISQKFYPQDGGESHLASKLRHCHPMYFVLFGLATDTANQVAPFMNCNSCDVNIFVGSNVFRTRFKSSVHVMQTRL